MIIEKEKKTWITVIKENKINLRLTNTINRGKDIFI
jgi:hypothetical protein